ncbi:MAG: gephyrin-like molybdotransferase Glp [Candidatus Auribacterota bacterium]|nr:gephyrin-like molybdotransferase Glp [Candidatus Auribacterota bacterium]
MITIEEALSIILAHIKPLTKSSADLSDCLDRVLAEDIISRDNIPPFANSAMDGFALRYADTIGASPETPIVLTVLEDLPAGSVARQKVGEKQAIRIMTGAPFPPGADAIVKVEDTGTIEEEGEDKVRIFREAGEGDHLRRAGESVKKGELVISRGSILRPPEIGMLAALGYPRVQVFPSPRVTIISTGDELQDIEEELRPGKIRDCNRYSLAAMVRKYGGTPASLGIASDRKEYLKKILSMAFTTDMVITSGGVSVGKYDLVREALRELGGELLIDRVAMKPGQPLTFTMVGDTPVFSLPGNPVSVLVSFLQFVRPALLRMQEKTKLRKPEVEAVLEEDCNEMTGRTHLIRVKVEMKGEDYSVRLTGPQGSGILRSLVLSNGLMVIPPNQGPIKAGTRVKVILTDEPEIE